MSPPSVSLRAPVPQPLLSLHYQHSLAHNSGTHPSTGSLLPMRLFRALPRLTPPQPLPWKIKGTCGLWGLCLGWSRPYSPLPTPPNSTPPKLPQAWGSPTQVFRQTKSRGKS